MPIAFFRNGVCVPLVTTPTAGVADEDVVARGGRCRGRASRSRRACGCTPCGLLLPQRRGADEVVLLPADDPAQIGFERASSSRRCRCRTGACRFEPQRVARAEAGRDQLDLRGRPRESPARRGRPTAAGRRSRSRPRRCSRCARRWRGRWRPRRARTSSTSSPPGRRRSAAAGRSSAAGPCTASSA